MVSLKIKPTGCCEPFDPTPWQDKEIVWKDKIFVKNLALIEKAKAKAPHQLMLADENSLWGADYLY